MQLFHPRLQADVPERKGAGTDRAAASWHESFMYLSADVSGYEKVEKDGDIMAIRQKIMIVESDTDMANLISLHLAKECYDTRIVSDGQSAIREAENYLPDLITLALMLPGLDGYQVCRQIRSVSRVPIIIVSSKSEVFDKVLALELGADDYIVKPFDSRELIARIKAVLRRTDPEPAPEQGAMRLKNASHSRKLVEYADLSVNLTNYTVTCRGVVMEMPPKEIELLYFLAASPGQVFTREQLLSNVWGYDYVGDTRTVDVHIKRLREKLKDSPHWSINTVWGVGYKFNLK